VGAHPDDVELCCGGTVIKLVGLGYRAGVVDLTQGEVGTMGSARQREKEARCATRVMGLALRENLKLPDANVEINLKSKLKLVRVIRRYKPHLMILPYWVQRHPDHEKASRLAYEACYLAGLAKLKAPGKPHRPFKILYSSSPATENPSFIVDISEQFKRKIEAISCYKSQFRTASGKKRVFPFGGDVFEFIEVAARRYGLLIRKTYGEAFIMKESMEVSDPMELSVNSI